MEAARGPSRLIDVSAQGTVFTDTRHHNHFMTLNTGPERSSPLLKDTQLGSGKVGTGRWDCRRHESSPHVTDVGLSPKGGRKERGYGMLDALHPPQMKSVKDARVESSFDSRARPHVAVSAGPPGDRCAARPLPSVSGPSHTAACSNECPPFLPLPSLPAICP